MAAGLPKGASAYAFGVRRFLAGLVVSLSAIGLLAGPASATWSIVGVDPETGEVGVAIASCVPVSQLGELDRPLFLLTLVPGVGAGVTQAQVNTGAPARIETLLEVGKKAEEAIADISSEEFDSQFDVRQHGIVVLGSDEASYTGPLTEPFSGDLQASNVAVQGNLLANGEVLDDSLAAFVASAGEPLADRLVAALAAGSLAGGDGRCDETAFFAHVSVAGPEDDRLDPAVVLTYGTLAEGDNPVLALQRDFADGERRKVVIPEENGFGSVAAFVALLAGLFMIAGGFLFWRRAYR